MTANGLLGGLKSRIAGSPPYVAALRARGGFHEAKRVDRRIVTLEPTGPVRGDILISYTRGIRFLQGPEEQVPATHTHFRELRHMAQTFLELGYRVDAITSDNRWFSPRKPYSIFVSTRWNMQRLASSVGGGCVRIMHLDTAHVLFQEAAEFARLLALQRRRGVTLPPHRYEAVTYGIERADCAVMLGNAFTESTWSYAGKPIYPIDVPGAVLFPEPEGKDFQAIRHRFLWLGSYGLVHKGLDLVLEAFAGSPELELLVFGPIDREPEFERAFERELHHTPNIRTFGWIDPASATFAEAVRSCVGLVYASCSEAGSGSVVTALHGGLIPIVSYESGITIPPSVGITLRDSTVPEIRAAVRRIAGESPERLAAMAAAAWTQARTHHTGAAYRARYREIIEDVVARFSRPRASMGGAPRAAGGRASAETDRAGEGAAPLPRRQRQAAGALEEG